MFSNRRFGYGSATFGYGGGRISRSFMDGISARTSLLGLWSTARRTWSGYSGAILRARRSSDSAERDFFPNGPQGEVSTAELRAWNGWNTARSTDDISNASIWARTNVTTTTDTIADNATNAQHYITDIAGLVVATGQVETGTVEMKAGTSSWGYLFLDGSSAFFNLATGTVGTIGSGLTATITDVGGGWYRCRVTKTRVNSTTTFRIGITTADNVLSYAGTGSTIQVRRIQFERASSFSTYEPRTTTAAGDSFLVTLHEQVENGRNLLARTEEFGDSYWSKNQTSVLSDTTTNPFGVSNADTVTVSAGVTLGTLFAGLWTNIATRLGTATGLSLSAGTYTYSIYAKPSSGLSHIQLRFGVASGLTSGSEAIFRLSDGVLIDRNVNSVSATSESVGDGWYRYTLTYTVTTGTWFVGVWFWNSTSITTAGTEGFHVWGAQLETGTTATTYERRTTHGAGTRLNFTQSTTTLQPIVCEQGVVVTENNRLAAKFVAADARRMSIASSTAMFNALHTTGGTVLCVSRANDTAATKAILNSNNGGSGAAGINFLRNASEAVFFQTTRLAGPATGSSIQDTSTDSSAAQSILAITVDPDNMTAANRLFGWQNGAVLAGFVNPETGTPGVENAANNLTLGAYAGGTSGFDGTISEVALFSDLISTADRVTLEDRAGDFYGVTVTQPITIATQPTSKLVTFGEAFTLTCEGTNVQTYNWQFRNAGDTAWSAVGVQTSTLNLVGEAAMNGREYRCVLINPNASETSNTATITAQEIVVLAKVGTFNSPTVHGSQAVSGVGFQPKVILPFTAYQTSSAQASNASISFGCADSDAQAAIGCLSQTALTTSSTGRSHDNTKAINHYATPAFSQVLEASRTSFDSDGFTLNWTDVDAVSRIINIVSLGGSTLEANLVQCQMNGTNSAESFAHGLSGAPTAILFFTGIQAVTPPNTSTILHMSLGAWAGGNQFGASIYSNNGVTTTETRRLLSTGHAIANLTTSIRRSLSVSSVDATNVNVTYPNVTSTSQLYFWMLCLRGCKAQVGTFDANGSLDPFSISCPGITPRLFLPIMVCEGVDFIGSVRTGLYYMIGASDGITNVSCGITDLSSVTTTNARRYQSSTTLAEYDDGGILRSQAVATFSGNSVVYDASTINSVYGQGGYLIIGE